MSSSAGVLQGAGAVGSVILALVADLTSEESRTKAMALVGITIGASFMVALVAGPLLAGLVGVSGIFWLMVGLAALGIAITAFVVPRPRSLRVHRDTEAVPAMLGSILKNKELLRLDFGIFALHAMLTASFLVVPSLLHDRLNVNSHSQWMVYLPVLLLSVAVMVPAIIVAEKYRRMKARVRRCRGGAGGKPVYARCRSARRLRRARRHHSFLCRLQRDGGEPALAGHQSGAPCGQRDRHRNLFEFAISRHFRRRHRGRLDTPDRGQRRRICLVGGSRAAMVTGRSDDAAAQLSDDATDSDRGRSSRRCRSSSLPGCGKYRAWPRSW